MEPYIPRSTWTPTRMLADVPSGWKGLEIVLGDIVERFCPKRRLALEFGVEYGFSTVAISNFFDLTLGVDHFQGDDHAGPTPGGCDRYMETSARLKPYENIQLIKMPAEQFIYCNERHYDLVHVDAFHDFHTTYTLGYWAAKHSPCVLFHDTMWFPDVAPAVERIAQDQKKTAYNFPEYNGLAMLV